jgi:hypothetical protein
MLTKKLMINVKNKLKRVRKKRTLCPPCKKKLIESFVKLIMEKKMINQPLNTTEILMIKGLYTDVINIIEDYLFGTKEQNKKKYEKNVVNILKEKIFTLPIWNNEYIVPYKLFVNLTQYYNINIYTEMYKYDYYKPTLALRCDYDDEMDSKLLSFNQLVNRHLPFIRPIVKRKIQYIIDFIKRWLMRGYDQGYHETEWILQQLKKNGCRMYYYDYDYFYDLIYFGCDLDWDIPLYYYYTNEMNRVIFRNTFIGNKQQQINQIILNDDIKEYDRNKIICKYDRNKIICKCGSIINRKGLKKHKQTKKHKEFINQK